MNAATQIVIWWLGFATAVALLACFTYITMGVLIKCSDQSWRYALKIAQLTTVRYWVDRMEREGLTVCRSEYRRMVAEQKPKSQHDFERVEFDASKKEQS